MSRTAYILGAGFSHYAGLPLQSDFTKELLAARDYGSGPSRAMVGFLDRFIHDVFDHSKQADAKYWPELEDVFTCIDLAANTGHHLGSLYSPARLRTVRRVLIARIMRMLHHKYSSAAKRQTPDLKRLFHFVESVDPENATFISLNWDVSLESVCLDRKKSCGISYGHGINAASFPDSGQVIESEKESGDPLFKITKMHGSINWLYCDCCRRVFWFHPSEVTHIADQILSKEEWREIRPDTAAKPRWECARCSGVVLGTRIATFSYRKALDFRMFQISWFRAEAALRQCSRWVFVGYSLPGADYEFKQLLKRVELSKRTRPTIFAVTGGSPEAVDKARLNYRRFFGRSIEVGKTFFSEGLSKSVVSQIV
ncbi:MAG TPA: hypothetical protein VN577_23030 [Terriglobales bacterium]|nr:hypothetical protein [Terriglobales bacterium]